MSTIIVLTGGGLKGAAASGCLGTEQKLVFVHVSYGQLAAKAEADAVRRLAAAIPEARSLAVEMPHLVGIELRLAEEAAGEEAAAARRLPATTAMTGLVPALVSVGVQCATRLAATQVALGISQHADADHLGLATVVGQSDRLKEFVHATNLALDALTPQRASLRLEAPLIDRTYAEIVKLAAHVSIPFEHTWSCTQPPSTGARPSAVCGRCDACKARAMAFTDARYADPLTTSQPVRPATPLPA